MQRTIAFVSLAVLSLATVALAVDGGKAKYVGGTSAVPFKEGKEAPISLKADDALLFDAGKDGKVSIPWASISDVEYGQKVGHRIGQAILLTPLVLFKKSRHHYVTLTYMDTDSKEQATVFEFDKGDIRLALASLKARTGKEISFQDDEARKQMGGGVSAKTAAVETKPEEKAPEPPKAEEATTTQP